MLRKAISIFKHERGQTLAEYGILLAIVAVALIIALSYLGSKVAAKYRETGDKIQNAQPY
ncbi:MAG: Flp family type IVb pilin [Moorellaceae bacterium]